MQYLDRAMTVDSIMHPTVMMVIQLTIVQLYTTL